MKIVKTGEKMKMVQRLVKSAKASEKVQRV